MMIFPELVVVVQQKQAVVSSYTAPIWMYCFNNKCNLGLTIPGTFLRSRNNKCVV